MMHMQWTPRGCGFMREVMSTPPPSRTTLRLDAEALTAFLAEAFPGRAPGEIAAITDLRPGHVRMQLAPNDRTLRPGGLISGPTQMGLVDVAAYAVVLAHIGIVPMAVTAGLNIQFLRGCPLVALNADAALLHLGRRTAIIDVRLWTDDAARPVAQASVTYMLPA